jgi:hypothetical protein
MLEGGYVLDPMITTTKMVLFGFAIAVTIGFSLGVLVGETKFCERAVMPCLVAIDTMPTARVIHRPGMCRLDPNWEADKLDLTGVRSRSEEPAIKEVRDLLLKIGVTTQDVSRRVADARNDPTFLLAPVDIVATYELQNLSRQNVEDRSIDSSPRLVRVTYG